MPHTYMVTTGPGSNPTVAPRCVSYSRIGSEHAFSETVFKVC